MRVVHRERLLVGQHAPHVGVPGDEPVLTDPVQPEVLDAPNPVPALGLTQCRARAEPVVIASSARSAPSSAAPSRTTAGSIQV
ncbi:hypothetical protein ACIQOV_39090, partial [Kitasatospora sp. NPDC091257]|uniref:hypothetical protein n=1 Tax=Kitasatospora sp. NPDC091257 TaxID=3364084 RepID=UPI003828CF28